MQERRKNTKTEILDVGGAVDISVETLKTAGAVALAVVGVMGTVVIAAVAPNLFSAIYKLYKSQGKYLSQKQVERKAKQTLYYLKRRGVIRIRKTPQETWVELTAVGFRAREKQDFDTLAISKPLKWDKKWWLVAADIPTKTHRLAADYFRRKLYDMHFKSLQRTLWFYPYNPTRELELVANRYGVERFVTIMEVSRLDKSDFEVLEGHFKKLEVI